MRFLHLFMNANGRRLQATARSRHNDVTIRNFLKRILTLLRSVIMRIKRSKAMRTRKIFCRRCRLRTYLPSVILRVRLVLCRLSSKRSRINITRPTRCMVRSTRVFILRSLNGTIERQNRCRTISVQRLTLSVTHRVRNVIINVTQRASSRISSNKTRRLNYLFNN